MYTRTSRVLFWGATLALISFAVLHVVSYSALVGDGSFFLLTILEREGFYAIDSPRLHALIVTQLPVVLGMKLGILSIKPLALLYSFGLRTTPALLYVFALARARRNQARLGALILLIAVVYKNTGAFAVGEYNFAYALVIAAFAVLVREEELTTFDCIALVLFAGALVRAYEALIFLGPALFVFTMIRLLSQQRKSRFRTLALALSAFCFAVATGIAFQSITDPRTPANATGAIDLDVVLVNKQFVWSAIALGAYFIVCMLKDRWVLPRILGLTIVAACVLALLTMSFPLTASYHQQYSVRAGAGFLLFLSILVLGLLRFTSLDHRDQAQSSTHTHTRPFGGSGSPNARDPFALIYHVIHY